MQLKAIIRNIAKEKRISAQLVLQNYMLERFLERVSLSPYQDNYIIKGGFLIASMVGLDTRATMDMDATIKGMPVNPETVREMLEAILSVPVEDDVSFELKSIGNIRKDDIYGGFRAALTANYGKMAIPLKLDITIGDSITPKEIEYEYKLMLEERSIRVLAYNLTTILAEKLEAVISRGDQSTRLRDYYDIYVLTKLESQNIDSVQLKLAIQKTSERRGSLEIMQQYRKILRAVRSSETMKQRWLDYQKDFEYAKGIMFEDTCDAAVSVMDKVCGKIKPAECGDD